MKSAEIRRMFLDHFARDHGHAEVASASLIPSAYDPSILLNTAGMQPLMPYFLGVEQPPASTLTSCQKCFRTVDIDEVGLTARHMTFFEMLGNFSFGAYFKPEAIAMAWELIVEKFQIPLDRLWVTVHEGDPALGLGLDTEARDLWLQVGMPADRIVALGEDNFWKAGATGPCGPCSEIFYDRGPEWGPDGQPGDEGDRYLEFYNLVFMQYRRDAAGVLHDLPNKNIDTGMGLERISSMLQGNVSIFEIDSVRPIVAWAEQRSGRTYGSDDAVTKAMRVLVDHGRGMTFLASDGVRPSNEGRGYVLRRVIRRAIQHADRIGIYPAREGRGASSGEGVLRELHALVVDTFGADHPQLVAQGALVADMLESEERRFLASLDAGATLLDGVLAELKPGHDVPGDAAFQLHDTHGFPVELTQELAAERGHGIDRSRFDELMQQQRERARAASGSGSTEAAAAAAFVRTAPETEFCGFDELEVHATVTAMQPIDGDADGRVLLKLDRSPLYAEGGGQVADGGAIAGDGGRAAVESVLRFDRDQVIVATVDGSLSVGDAVTVTVDAAARASSESNHTATHLLQAALRDVLGDGVQQAGSLVEPGRLRFDFTHDAALTTEQLAAVEQRVNERIAASEPVQWEEMPIDVARERGATMLFGEKYGDVVRAVSVGDGSWSMELCGGTHVTNTGRIGTMLVLSQSSVGASTRRIEALTGSVALEWLRSRAAVADDAARLLGVELERVPARVEELQRSNRALERELSTLRSSGALDAALATRTDTGTFSVVAYRDDSLGSDELLDLADRLRGKLGSGAVVILGSVVAADKVSLLVSASEGAVAAGAHAGTIVKAAAGIVGGGGGGRPNMARAGGSDPSRLDEALAAGRDAVTSIS